MDGAPLLFLEALSLRLDLASRDWLGTQGVCGLLGQGRPTALTLLTVLSQVRKAAQALNPGLLCVACGSYRRGKATCGDMDVLLTHPDGRSHQGIFSRLLDSLRQQGISPTPR